MISDKDLPAFMKNSLLSAYADMKKVKTTADYKRLLKTAPSFVFTKTNDFIQAIKADYIVILVAPDKYYQFEILCHDPFSMRVLVDNMHFLRITDEKFEQIIMDNYPIDVSNPT